MVSFLTSFTLGWSYNFLWTLAEACNVLEHWDLFSCWLWNALTVMWTSLVHALNDRGRGPSHLYCPNQKQNNCQTCEWDYSRSSRLDEQPAEHRWMSKSSQDVPSLAHTSKINLLIPRLVNKSKWLFCITKLWDCLLCSKS